MRYINLRFTHFTYLLKVSSVRYASVWVVKRLTVGFKLTVCKTYCLTIDYDIKINK